MAPVEKLVGAELQIARRYQANPVPVAVSEVLPRLSSSYAYSRTPKEKAHLGSALHTTETSIRPPSRNPASRLGSCSYHPDDLHSSWAENKGTRSTPEALWVERWTAGTVEVSSRPNGPWYVFFAALISESC